MTALEVRPTPPAQGRRREVLGSTARSRARHLAVQLAVVLAAVLVAWSTKFGVGVVLAVTATLLGVLLVARPQVGALASVGLIFSNAVVIAVHNHGAPSAVTYLVPLLFLLTIAYRVFAQREPLVFPQPTVWVVAFFLAQILGAVGSRNPQVSVSTLQTFALEGLLLFVLITNAIRGYDLIRLASIVLVVVAAALATLTLVQEVGHLSGTMAGFSTKSNALVDKANGGGSARHAGPIGEQNRWAQSLAMVLPVGIALAVADKKWLVRTTSKIGIGLITAGIIITYSRGALVGLLITGTIGVLLKWIRPRTALAVLALGVVGIGLFAPVFAYRATTVVTARSSVGSSTDTGAAADGSFVNRSTEANAAVSVFLHHPVAGVGIGLFPTYFQDEARRQGAVRIVGVDREAHNLYLGLAAETGILGLVTFGGFAMAILRPLARVRRHNRGTRDDVATLAAGYAFAFTTYLTTGLFLHFAYIRYFWLLAALAAAMGMVDHGRRAAPAPAPLVAASA